MRVCVVEDDLANRDLLVELLMLEGYGVLEAADGFQALAVLRAHPEPLVVVLDLVLPGLEGDQVLAVVAADPDLAARLAFVLVTASPQKAPVEMTDLLVAVIAKPFVLTTLLSAAHEAASALSRGSATPHDHTGARPA